MHKQVWDARDVGVLGYLDVDLSADLVLDCAERRYALFPVSE